MFRLSLVWLGWMVAISWGADWPQWRGPTRDGVAGSAPREWPRELKRAWKVEVGEGHSGPVVAEGRVFVQTRVEGDEVLRCLNLDDGKEVWQTKVAVDANLDGAVGWHGKMPRATPCVADGRVYTLSVSGVISCQEADTGKLVWRRSFEKEFAKPYPIFGAATSPIVYDGLVAVWVGGPDGGALLGLDAKTGRTRWTLPGDGPGYASPVLVTQGKRKLLLTQSQKLLVAADAASGKLAWSLPFTTGYEQNSVTPLVADGKVIYSGYEKQVFAARLPRPGERAPTAAWAVRDQAFYMSSPVLAGDRVVGLSSKGGGTLVVIAAATGKVVWQQADASREYAAFIRAGDRVLMQTTEGKVVVFDPAAEKFETTAEYTVADDKTWAHPAFTGEALVVKDKLHLQVWKLK